MCDQSEVISSHAICGPKVIRLSTGEYIKVFNAKSGFTRRRWFPKYQAFVHNSQQLLQYGFHTLTITHLYYLPHINAYAVRYDSLPGDDFRHVFKKDPAQGLEPLMDFVVSLHEKGVYFHGMHLGNILFDKDGKFGIIDMADLSFHRAPLRMDLRVRQLRRLLRYHQDQPYFESIGIESVVSLYMEKSGFSRLRKQFFRLFLCVHQRLL